MWRLENYKRESVCIEAVMTERPILPQSKRRATRKPTRDRGITAPRMSDSKKLLSVPIGGKGWVGLAENAHPRDFLKSFFLPFSSEFRICTRL